MLIGLFDIFTCLQIQYSLAECWPTVLYCTVY